MTGDKLAFISFEPSNGRFIALVSMEWVLSSKGDPEVVLGKATLIYERSITSMRSILIDIQAARTNHELVPARKIWQLGDSIFELVDYLEKLSLKLDNLYEHLSRDLHIKRKWLEKVVILRRYIPQEVIIPESLNWGRCEKGTRRIALKLREGLPLN